MAKLKIKLLANDYYYYIINSSSSLNHYNFSVLQDKVLFQIFKTKWVITLSIFICTELSKYS